MEQQKNATVVFKSCGCHIDRQSLKKSYRGIRCPQHDSAVDHYDIECIACGDTFEARGMALNSKFCKQCRSKAVAGNAIAYTFACGHTSPSETITERSAHNRKPLCPVCGATGVRRVSVRCGCGREFETGPQGGRAKYCPQCQKVAYANGNRSRRTRADLQECRIPCSVRGCRGFRRDPKPGEDPRFIRYCIRHGERTADFIGHNPMPDKLRVLAPGDRLERLFMPVDMVAEMALYYGALSAGR